MRLETAEIHHKLENCGLKNLNLIPDVHGTIFLHHNKSANQLVELFKNIFNVSVTEEICNGSNHCIHVHELFYLFIKNKPRGAK